MRNRKLTLHLKYVYIFGSYRRVHRVVWTVHRHGREPQENQGGDRWRQLALSRGENRTLINKKKLLQLYGTWHIAGRTVGIYILCYYILPIFNSISVEC